MNHFLDLLVFDGRFAVCRLDPQSVIPEWAFQGTFFSVTRTVDEISIVCSEASVPEDINGERGWRALRVVGTQDFSLVGILASLTAPLALAKISLFAVSTFDTDYLLIKDEDLSRAVVVLEDFGHRFTTG